MSGGTAVAGAPTDDGNGTDSGSAYVFNFSNPMPLSADKATARIWWNKHVLGRSDDRVDIKGDFTLDQASNGIMITTNSAGLNVIDEDITATFGGMFEETIPAGSLVEIDPISNPDQFVYQPAAPSEPVDKVELEYIDGSPVGMFKVRWDDIDLRPKEADLDASDPDGDNVPVPFTFDIGNNKGSLNLGFEITKNKLDIKEYKSTD